MSHETNTASTTISSATITTIEQLEALYGQPGEASLVKVADWVTPGRILAAQSEQQIGGDDYDAAWADRAKETMW